jgi:hypothetical protein
MERNANKVIHVLMKDTHELHKERMKVHAKIKDSDNLKWTMATCKLPNKEEEFFKVLPKMNEIVDLTEDKPCIIRPII